MSAGLRGLVSAGLAGLLSAGLFGCAGRSVRTLGDSAEVFAAVCDPSKTGDARVRGSVWMKAKSPEQSGQFPALVQVDWPDRLRLEVTNLLGGTEALLEVRGERMSLQIPGRGANAGGSREVVGTWGGIPLRWATTLFSGRVPCPTLTSEWKLDWVGDAELTATRVRGVGLGERFSYQLKTWAGHPWVESVDWRAGSGAGLDKAAGAATTLRVELKDPDLKTGRPKRWEAKSARGEVSIRWKDREALPSEAKTMRHRDVHDS